MEAIRSILFVLCLCRLATVEAQGQETGLRNPSFERAKPAQSEEAASWNSWGPCLQRETQWTPVREGTSLLAYHHWRVEDGASSSGIWQDVPHVKRGEHYTFQVFVNVNRPADGKRGPRSVTIRMESTLHGRQVVLNAREFNAGHLATKEDWSPLVVTATAATDSLRVLIVVHPAEEGPRDAAVKFDQASLSRSRDR